MLQRRAVCRCLPGCSSSGLEYCSKSISFNDEKCPIFIYLVLNWKLNLAFLLIIYIKVEKNHLKLGQTFNSMTGLLVMFGDRLISSRFPAPFTSASCSATHHISKPDFRCSLLPVLHRRFSPWLLLPLPICRSKVWACQPASLLVHSDSSRSGQEERVIRLSDDTWADSVLLGVGGGGRGGGRADEQARAELTGFRTWKDLVASSGQRRYCKLLMLRLSFTNCEVEKTIPT